MNGLLWIAQLLLAGIFLFVGTAKVLAYERLASALEARKKRKPINLPRGVVVTVGVLEILGAIGVIVPASLTPAVLEPGYLLVRLSAAGLALLMVAAGIYHLIRREEAAPAVAAFLLALFIIVGRWPR